MGIEEVNTRPMEEAPKDGTEIIGFFEGEEPRVINWSECRECAGAPNPHGYFGPGWEQTEVGLIEFNNPVGWKPVGGAVTRNE